MKKLMLSILLCFLCGAALWAEDYEVTYQISGYNTSADDFIIDSYGEKPYGSRVYFESEYGSTVGNRFNQIPRNKEAKLWLEGYDGCVIRSVVLSMCSNNKAGSCALIVSDEKEGDAILYTQRTCEFASDEWYGSWVSKDLGVYVDIKKDMQMLRPVEGMICVNLKGGTKEGSVYLNSITIHYSTQKKIESPLGYLFEKVEPKGSLEVGDVIMFYRSGDAAGDIDGMETSHYLDAIGITATGNVVESDVEFFTLSESEDNHWVLTDQYDRVLGATKAQSLEWDKGVTTWDIELGYNGAIVSSTNEKYGSLRYNVPSGGYPRFWNYTSKSLTLPYIYKKVKQNEPVVCKSVTLPWEERTVEFGVQDTVVIKTSIQPAKATDKRLLWKSDNEKVASVKNGIVTLHSLGDAVIFVSTRDGGASAQMLLHVVEASAIEDSKANASAKRDGKFLRNRSVVIRKSDKEYTIGGVRR